MNEAELRHRLEELHEALERTPDLGAETRELLRTVTDDIDQLLVRAQPAEAAATAATEVTAVERERRDSIVARLREATRRLEVEHPRLVLATEDVIEVITAPFR